MATLIDEYVDVRALRAALDDAATSRRPELGVTPERYRVDRTEPPPKRSPDAAAYARSSIGEGFECSNRSRGATRRSANATMRAPRSAQSRARFTAPRVPHRWHPLLRRAITRTVMLLDGSEGTDCRNAIDARDALRAA
jgi:hypothetical protein